MKFEVDGKKHTLWTTKKADEEYSKFRRKNQTTCKNCGRTVGLGVSHFWGRSISATRYDDNNCDVLCWLPCHYNWEHQKNGDYMKFMIKKLGKKGYEELEKKARQSQTKREWSIMDFQIRMIGIK